MSTGNSKSSKKDLIIEAAIRVFSQKGYHHTKMEEIAIEAGIGKGTIYEYFGSKLQLLQEIMVQSFSLYDRSMVAHEMKSLSMEDKIKMLLAGHFKFCQENKELTRILFWDTEIMDEELRDWACQKRAEKEQHLQNFIEAGISRGEIRALDAKILTVMISGVLGAIWVPVVIEGWDIDADIVAEQVTDILMSGIKR